MKVHNTFSAVALSLVGLGLSGMAQAEYVGASSDTANVAVGVSTVNGGPHVAGRAGISVSSLGSSNLVDFQGISAYGTSSATSPVVHTLDYASSAPTDHSAMGYFNFVQVGSADIWFGEWSQTASASDGTHAVYYVGDNTGTTVPTSGTATYTVAGVGDYGNSGLLSGTFSADFSAATLSGSIGNSGSTKVLTIDSTINASTASFSGTAVQFADGSVVGGASSGKFYGASAASLAGIATFADSKYDVAYGGTKN